MSWNKEVFAYFMEMGTGKSKVLIDNISMLYDKGKINSALIIAPQDSLESVNLISPNPLPCELGLAPPNCSCNVPVPAVNVALPSITTDE